MQLKFGKVQKEEQFNYKCQQRQNNENKLNKKFTLNEIEEKLKLMKLLKRKTTKNGEIFFC